MAVRWLYRCNHVKQAEYGDEVTIVSVSQTTNNLSNKACKLTLYLVEEKWDAIVS